VSDDDALSSWGLATPGNLCIAMRPNTRHGGPATAGPPSDARPAQGVASDEGLLPCPNCGREFWGKSGVSLHRCRVHPEAYHRDHVPEQRRKARWDYKEKVLLAWGEITMLEAGIVVNSKTLAEQFPGRSSEAIKKMGQSEDYGCMKCTTTLLGGVLPLQLVTLEHMTVGWTGVIPLKPKPPSGHHQCHPRLHKNSLRSGLLGLKRLTAVWMVGCLEEGAGGSSIRLGGCVIRSNSAS